MIMPKCTNEGCDNNTRGHPICSKCRWKQETHMKPCETPGCRSKCMHGICSSCRNTNWRAERRQQRQQVKEPTDDEITQKLIELLTERGYTVNQETKQIHQ